MQSHETSQLPRVVDFLQLAENNRQFEGHLPISELGRMHDVLNSTDGNVTVKLKFGRKYGIRSLTGSVSADLDLTCQRCLNPIKVNVKGKFCFALIKSADKNEDLPQSMEPYVIEGDKQSIEDIVIDELLISIPIVAKHDEACSDYISDQDEVVDEKTHKPFASIKDLFI